MAGFVDVIEGGGGGEKREQSKACWRGHGGN